MAPPEPITPPSDDLALPQPGARAPAEAEAEAPAPAAAPDDAGTWQGVRDFARAQGVELPYGDDAQALSGLLQAYRRAQERDYYAELGQRWAPHQEAIGKAIAAQQAPPPAPPKAWEPPEFQSSWVNMVERDPDTGAIRAKPGYDPAIADKVGKYVAWRERFLETPHEMMRGLIEEEARRVATEVVAAQHERAVADQLIAQHANWLFTQGASGRELTPDGVVYARAVDVLHRSGIQDVALLDGLARTLVEHANLRARAPSAPPAPPTPTAAAAAPVGARSPSAAGSARGGGGRAAKSSSAGLSLREMLDRSLQDFPTEIGD